jgi:hypothetical protein
MARSLNSFSNPPAGRPLIRPQADDSFAHPPYHHLNKTSAFFMERSKASFLNGGLPFLLIPTAIITLTVALIAKRSASPDTLSVIALILGILGLVFGVARAGPIAAIIVGNLALKQSQANYAPISNNRDGLARAGIILGWIGIGLCAVAVVGSLPFSMSD